MSGFDPSVPLVVNVALTGMVPRRADNPAVPISPEEIERDVQRCFQAGARVFHIHARDEAETPVPHRQVFQEIIRRVRETVPDAILCVTTSGRVYRTFDERSGVLSLDGTLKPDLASLTLGSMNFPKQGVLNDPEMIRRLANCMTLHGVVPELEVFDLGMVDYAHYLIKEGVLRPPFVFNIILGSLGTLAAKGLNLALMVERLPENAFWSAAGIGRFQFPMNALGVVLGGHVRTGLEDNLYKDPGKRERASNQWLVQRIVGVARALGRAVADPQEARRLMGLSQ